MLGPSTPATFLADIPANYRIDYYPERLQPFTIWFRGHVVRFEGLEAVARKWVQKQAERAAEQSNWDEENQGWRVEGKLTPSIVQIPATVYRPISTITTGAGPEATVTVILVDNPTKAEFIPLPSTTYTSVNYWEMPRPRAELLP